MIVSVKPAALKTSQQSKWWAALRKRYWLTEDTIGLSPTGTQQEMTLQRSISLTNCLTLTASNDYQQGGNNEANGTDSPLTR